MLRPERLAVGQSHLVLQLQAIALGGGHQEVIFTGERAGECDVLIYRSGGVSAGREQTVVHVIQVDARGLSTSLV